MILNQEAKVLLGLRQGSHGANQWCFPGGGVELGETVREAAIRETKEETGIIINNLELIAVVDELEYLESDEKQHLVIGFKADSQSQVAVLTEPNKFVQWQWFDLKNLPPNLLEATRLMIENYKKKVIYIYDS